MKEIILKELKLENFKGQTRTVVFNTNTTVITGRNGAGKSTIMKAFNWLLTGRTDSAAKANSELFDNTKPLTQDTPSASVSALIAVDGTEHKLQRTAKAKFTRPKGNTEYVKASSDEYRFYIDGMPYKSTEFDDWVEAQIAPPAILPMCLNGDVFALLTLNKPLDARKVLTDIIGEKRPRDAAKFAQIQAEIDKVGVDAFIAGCGAKIKAANDSLADLPVKITQYREFVDNAKKELEGTPDLQKRKGELEQLLKNAQEARSAIIADNEAKNAEYRRIVSRKAEINMLTSVLEQNITACVAKSKTAQEQLDAIYKMLADGVTHCGYCGSELKLSDKQRADYVEKSAKCGDTIADLALKKAAAELELSDLKKELDGYVLPEIVPMDTADIDNRIAEINRQISEVNGEISVQDYKRSEMQRLEASAAAMEMSRAMYAGQLAEAERNKMLADEYAQMCAELLSDEVNKGLEDIRIEMFEVQKNGERKPSCVITNAEGVKYTTLNYSARLLANAELSRLFCTLADVDVPCFVDECSVFDSEHLPDFDGAQMIYIRCSDDQELVVF